MNLVGLKRFSCARKGSLTLKNVLLSIKFAKPVGF